MRFRKKREEEPRVGITPLIDIVFLLLIFFMLTSHFDVASGIRIRLPKAIQRVQEVEDGKLNILLDRRGRIYSEGKQLNENEFKEKLISMVEKNQHVHLILQADKDVKHGKVVKIMDLAKTVGVRSIVIAASWDTEKAL